VAAQPGKAASLSVEELGHLGVGLEERVVGDAQAQAQQLLMQLGGSGQQLGLAALRGLPRARDLGEQDARPIAAQLGGQAVADRTRHPAAGGHQADLDLAGAPAFADDEVAQGTLAAAPVPRTEAGFAKEVEDPPTGLVADLRRQQAVLERLDLIPAAGGMKAADQHALGVGPERVLELVAIAPELLGRDALGQLDVGEAAQAAQGVQRLLGLDLELTGVGEHLPGHAGVVGLGGDAVRTGGQDLLDSGPAEGALGRGQPRPDDVAGNPPGDEDDPPVVAGHAVAAIGEGIDRQLQPGAALGTRARLGGWGTGRRGLGRLEDPR